MRIKTIKHNLKLISKCVETKIKPFHYNSLFLLYLIYFAVFIEIYNFFTQLIFFWNEIITALKYTLIMSSTLESFGNIPSNAWFAKFSNFEINFLIQFMFQNFNPVDGAS